MKCIYRCIDCQLTIEVVPDETVPARTLVWLGRNNAGLVFVACPVCRLQLHREGERAPRERKHVRENER